MNETLTKQRFWLVGLGSHMPVIPGDVLDMPGAPEPVRLVSLHGPEARVATSAGASMVDLATVGIVKADGALVRPRPAEGPIDHRAHRLGALSGAGEEELFYLLWASGDGFTAPRLYYLTEAAGLIAYLGCCANPANSAAQLVRRRPREEDRVIASFSRAGLTETILQPTLVQP